MVPWLRGVLGVLSVKHQHATDTRAATLADALPWIVRWPGVLLTALWAFAEGTVFFLLPDIPLSVAAMYRPRRALLHWIALIAGAVLAGALMFLWAARSPSAAAVVEHVPRVHAPMFDLVRSDFRDAGVMGVTRGPARGVPYKVYAVSAPEVGLTLGPFLAASSVARAWRPMLVWACFSLLGIFLVRIGRGHWRTPVALAFWGVSTLAYWLSLG
jgi:hypothetical protein